MNHLSEAFIQRAQNICMKYIHKYMKLPNNNIREITAATDATNTAYIRTATYER